MRLLAWALIFFLSIQCASALEPKEIEKFTALIKPETRELIACWSDVVDRAKAQGMSNEEFAGILEKACPREVERYNKAFLERVPVPRIDESRRDEVERKAHLYCSLSYTTSFLVEFRIGTD